MNKRYLMKLIQDAQVTPAMIAVELECSVQTVKNLLDGKHPGSKLIKPLAHYLGTTKEDLMHGPKSNKVH